jgi:hypothetical protein
MRSLGGEQNIWPRGRRRPWPKRSASEERRRQRRRSTRRSGTENSRTPFVLLSFSSLFAAMSLMSERPSSCMKERMAGLEEAKKALAAERETQAARALAVARAAAAGLEAEIVPRKGPVRVWEGAKARMLQAGSRAGCCCSSGGSRRCSPRVRAGRGDGEECGVPCGSRVEAQ